MRRILPILPILPILLLLLAGAAHAAPPLRPYSGIGVLQLRSGAAGEPATIPVYEEPGLQRVAELVPAAFPRLAGDPQEPLLAVEAVRGPWLRVAYDDAGRQGWIERPRSWQYLRWEEFLPGRVVRVLSGMKKALYALHGEPGPGSPETGTVARDQQFRVLRVEEEWARSDTPAGWFRWRDGDGRLTVSP